MKAGRVIFLARSEKLRRGQCHAVAQRAVKCLRSSVHDFRRIRHATHDLGALADRCELMRFGLRKLVEDRLRQFVLFEIVG